MKTAEIVTGDRFGRLTAEFIAGRRTGQGSVWQFRCDCGSVKNIAAVSVKRGLTKSCGCLRREIAGGKSTHGKSKTREYRIWSGIKLRCEDPRYSNWERYGGRGIKVCKRWLKFENFIADMGLSPIGTTLDRIDNNGNYEPKNCRWATRKQQALNRSSNRLIEYKGVTRALKEWSEIYDIAGPTLKRRIDKGWSINKAMETPVRAWSNHALS